MILSDYKDFPHTGRILGLDWGLRRCGVAVSDEKRDFVFVREQINIKEQAELISAVLDLVQDDKIVGIVIGLPLYLDGTDSDTTKMVRQFADDLSKKNRFTNYFHRRKFDQHHGRTRNDKKRAGQR